MKFTSEIRDINDIFSNDMIVDIIEKAVNELPYNDFNDMGYQNLNDWNIGITNKQYAQILMLKNNIMNIDLEQYDENKKCINVYYKYGTFKCYYVKKDKEKEYEFYKVDDNPLKDLNKILYYYYL